MNCFRGKSGVTNFRRYENNTPTNDISQRFRSGIYDSNRYFGYGSTSMISSTSSSKIPEKRGVLQYSNYKANTMFNDPKQENNFTSKFYVNRFSSNNNKQEQPQMKYFIGNYQNNNKEEPVAFEQKFYLTTNENDKETFVRPTSFYQRYSSYMPKIMMNEKNDTNPIDFSHFASTKQSSITEKTNNLLYNNDILSNYRKNFTNENNDEPYNSNNNDIGNHENQNNNFQNFNNANKSTFNASLFFAKQNLYSEQNNHMISQTNQDNKEDIEYNFFKDKNEQPYVEPNSNYAFLRKQNESETNPNDYDFLRKQNESTNDKNNYNYDFLRKQNESTNNKTNYNYDFLRKQNESTNDKTNYNYDFLRKQDESTNNTNEYDFLRTQNESTNNTNEYEFLRSQKETNLNTNDYNFFKNTKENNNNLETLRNGSKKTDCDIDDERSEVSLDILAEIELEMPKKKPQQEVNPVELKDINDKTINLQEKLAKFRETISLVKKTEEEYIDLFPQENINNDKSNENQKDQNGNDQEDESTFKDFQNDMMSEPSLIFADTNNYNTNGN